MQDVASNKNGEYYPQPVHTQAVRKRIIYENGAAVYVPDGVETNKDDR